MKSCSLNNVDVVSFTFPKKQRTCTVQEKKKSATAHPTVNSKRSCGCKRPPSSEKLLPPPSPRRHHHRRRQRIRTRSHRRETKKVKGKTDDIDIDIDIDVKMEGVGGANCEEHDVVVADDDDEEAVESKIAALQRIVPGGHSLGPDQLFQETADYILTLQCQIEAMRLLATLLLLQGLEEDNKHNNSKFGA